MKKNRAFSLIELSIVILVVGVLIAGVMQGVDMVRKTELSTARNLTINSGIDSIESMTLWLEATQAFSEKSLVNSSNSSNIANGDPIQYWYDVNPRATNSKVFTNTVSSRRPTYVRNGLNNLPSMLFDGEGDALKTTSTFGEFFRSNELTIFMVLMNNNTTTSDSRNFTLIDSGGTSRINISMASTTPFSTIGGGVSNSYTFSFNTDRIPLLASFRLKTNNSLEIRANGTSSGAISKTNSAMLDLSTAITIYLGNETAALGPLFSISELIFFDRALSDEDRLYIEKYLSKKWKIALN